MAFDPTTLPTASPVDPSGIITTPAAGAQLGAQEVKDARVADPKPVSGIKADLSPVAAAGLELARKVLWFMAAAIVILMLFLGVMEYVSIANQDAVDTSVLRQTMVGGTFPEPARIEKWEDALRGLLPGNGTPPGAAGQANSPASPAGMTANQTKEWLDVLDILHRGGGVSQRQIVALRPCTNPPASPLRVQIITDCVDLLDVIDKEAMSSAVNLDKDRLLADFAKQVDEHHQSFRTFFMQISQMILLNLLLPILTALLGYIFGTQSKSSATP